MIDPSIADAGIQGSIVVIGYLLGRMDLKLDKLLNPSSTKP